VLSQSAPSLPVAAEPTVRLDGALAVLSLGRGEGRFNGDSIAAIDACLDEVLASPATALITTADSKIWCNGFDTAWLAEHKDAAADTMVATERLFARLLTFPIPTIAAIGGHVFAGGVMLALSHDVRIMRADRGYLCLPEVDLGVVFTPGMTALLTATMTAPTARRAMVLGHRFTPDEALAAGLVSEVAPLEELAERARAVAAALSGRSREAVSGLKHRIYAEVVAQLGATPPDQGMLAALYAAMS
jgi:enoyl-CoA hydratase/carnithine racemase